MFRTYGMLVLLTFFLTMPGCQTTTAKEHNQMYGLIGEFKANPGQRDQLMTILLANASSMPGCQSYVVAGDAADPDTIWVTEVWTSKEDHAASLSLPAVQEAMQKGRPLIAGFGQRHETMPAGGHGLVETSGN